MTSLNVLDKAFKHKFDSDYFNTIHFCAQLYIYSTLAFSNAGLILLKIRKLNINFQTLPMDIYFYKFILIMILSMYIKLFYELNYLELPIFLNFYDRFVLFLSKTMTGISQSVDDAKQLLPISNRFDFESIGSSHSIWCLIIYICTFTVFKLNKKLYFHNKTKRHNKSLKFNNYSIASSFRKLILISFCKIVLAGIIYIALKNPEAQPKPIRFDNKIWNKRYFLSIEYYEDIYLIKEQDFNHILKWHCLSKLKLKSFDKFYQTLLLLSGSGVARVQNRGEQLFRRFKGGAKNDIEGRKNS